MDDKDCRVLRKLLEHTEAIQRYCGDCASLSDFETDSMRVEATVFNLMQIGDLAKSSLSDAAKEALPTIPWQQIYGMRSRIVHAAFRTGGGMTHKLTHWTKFAGGNSGENSMNELLISERKGRDSTRPWDSAGSASPSPPGRQMPFIYIQNTPGVPLGISGVFFE